MDEFTDRYEDFKSQLLQAHPYLTEQYFMENYVAKLRQDLRCFVRTARPNSLGDAVWFAKQFEQGLKGPEFLPELQFQQN